MYRKPFKNPIVSPIQKKDIKIPDTHKAVKDIGELVAGISEVLSNINDRIDSLSSKIDSVSKESKESDTAIREELKKKLESELVLEIDRKELKGDPGKDAEAPDIDYEYIIDEVSKLIQVPDPIPGKDGDTPVVDYNMIIDSVLMRVDMPKPIVDYAYIISKLPNPEKIDIPSVLEQVFEEISKGKMIEIKHIKGLEDAHRSLRNAPKAILHGGGDTVKAGTNVTAVRNSDGTTTISATGGFQTIQASEVPNGVLKSFTFPSATAQPSFIMSDNVVMRATTGSGTVNWTWNNGTKKATLTIPPSDDIIGII